MAHKVHPKAFRIKGTGDWDSRWFERKNFVNFLQEDFVIRNFLEKRLEEAGLANIEIERFAGKTNIIISTSRPGLIIGRGGSGIEEIRRALEALLLRRKPASVKTTAGKPDSVKTTAGKEIRLEIQEIKNPWESASLTAQWIAQQLEKRMPHRRVLKQALTKVMANKNVQGAKIHIAGRLGGTEIARSESLRMGRLPLQTLRARIDYSLKEAKTTYGMIGVKVWMYKGEKFE